MNFLQIVQRTAVEAGRTDGGPTSIADAVGDEASMKNAAADAWAALQLEPYNWSWMRQRASGPIVAGTASYTGATLGLASFGRWREPSRHWKPVVTDANGVRSGLQWLDYDDWVARFSDPTIASAAPQFWSIANDRSLVLGPVPADNATLEMQYWSAPTELLTDTDTPTFPAEFHIMLVWRALAEMGAFDSAPEMFTRAAANYDRMHTLLKSQFGEQIRFETARL